MLPLIHVRIHLQGVQLISYARSHGRGLFRTPEFIAIIRYPAFKGGSAACALWACRQVNGGQLLAGPLEQFASNVLVNCLCAEPGPHFVLMDQTDKRWILSGDK